MGSQELCLLSSAVLGVYGLRGTLAGCGRLGNEGFRVGTQAIQDSDS